MSQQLHSGQSSVFNRVRVCTSLQYLVDYTQRILSTLLDLILKSLLLASLLFQTVIICIFYDSVVNLCRVEHINQLALLMATTPRCLRPVYYSAIIYKGNSYKNYTTTYNR